MTSNNQSITDFAVSTLTHINQVKQDKMLSDLEAIRSNYFNGIKSSKIDISTDSLIVNNLTKIIHYSVTFVEKNCTAIAKMLTAEISSEFKLNTCINLIMDITNALFPQNQIVTYINHFVTLLFPHIIDDPTPVTKTREGVPNQGPAQVETTSLKSKGSIKRSWGYVLKRSGCK